MHVCNILMRTHIATFVVMLILFSPAKTLDLNVKFPEDYVTLPLFNSESTYLMSLLQSFSDNELGQTMKLSNKMINTVSGWHKKWGTYKDTDSAIKDCALPCAFAMKGEAYKSLNIKDFNDKELNFAQRHLIILSGLYGILRPFDLIKPYRLEMGQTMGLDNNFASLNAYWSSLFKKPIKQKLKEIDANIILNLASDEYSKVVTRSSVDSRMVTCSFKEETSNGVKSISTFAKQARGEMARFVIQKEIKEIEKLKDFNRLGYKINHDLSTLNHIIFTRLTKQ
ncbi:MAG: hypothetical protein COA49_01890 [Bacteroidetes bacterium]|nr:MAG: hypothetical protein COA49_01890 [Bacteroidota bacterium]